MKKRFKIILFIIIIIIILLLIIKNFITVSIKNEFITKEQWKKDIEYISKNLPKKHINLFFKIDREKFYNSIEKLENDLENLDSSEIQVRIMEIIASVGDSHSTIRNFQSNIIYPIKTYWFKEGLYVIEADFQYKEILGCKILSINNVPIENIVKNIDTLIPNENKFMLRLKEPEYLVDPKVMEYFKVTKGNNEMNFTLQDLNGGTFNTKVIPKRTNEIKYLPLSDSVNIKPFYSEKEDAFWSKYLENEKILYCQFNSCKIGTPSKNDINSIITTVKEKKVEKLIVDMRNNCGGVYTGKNKFVSKIASITNEKSPTKLYVIVGRRTFSSGILYVLEFQKLTNAKFFGEPTGGKPIHYGDMRNMTLPNSKLNITYSTKFLKTSTNEADTFTPDFIIEPSIKDYLKGIDPVIETIKSKH